MVCFAFAFSLPYLYPELWGEVGGEDGLCSNEMLPTPYHLSLFVSLTGLVC